MPVDDRSTTPTPHPTETINELSRQFWNSAILRACIKLELFSLLQVEGPLTADEVANHLGANIRFTDALLSAANALGLLEKGGGRYAVSEPAGQFLVPGSADYVGNLVLHITNYWSTWGNLDQLVLDGQTELPFENGFTSQDTYWRDYMAGQHDRAVAGQGEHLANVVDLSDRELLLDLGGGAASYSIALCRANPDLHSIVIDAPEPLSIAEPLVAEAGMDDRISLREGDVLRNDLPAGADAALLSGVVLIKSESECRTLFDRTYDALEPSGLMIVQDFMRLDHSPRRRFLDTMMDLYVLIGFAPEAADRPGELYEQWLADAGFDDIEQAALPTQLAVITAEKTETPG